MQFCSSITALLFSLLTASTGHAAIHGAVEYSGEPSQMLLLTLGLFLK